MKAIKLLVLLALSLVATPTVAAPFACAIVAQDQPVTITTAQARHDAPARLRDCTGAMIHGGDALVCYARKDGRRSCRTLGDGQRIDPAAFDGNTDSESFGFFAMLRGDHQVNLGMSRGQDDAGAMPTGTILPLQRALVLAPGDTGLPYPLQVEVFRDDAIKPFLAVRHDKARELALSPRKLAAGHAYHWRITGSPGVLSGSFRVATRADAARVNETIDATLAGQQLPPRARALIVADILASAGHPWDAARVLAEAGMPPGIAWSLP